MSTSVTKRPRLDCYAHVHLRLLLVCLCAVMCVKKLRGHSGKRRQPSGLLVGADSPSIHYSIGEDAGGSVCGTAHDTAQKSEEPMLANDDRNRCMFFRHRVASEDGNRCMSIQHTAAPELVRLEHHSEEPYMATKNSHRLV